MTIQITTGLEPIGRLSDALEAGVAGLNRVDAGLATVLAAIQEVLRKMSALDDKITALQAAVTAENTVIDSAVTLISGFKAQLDAAVQAALAAGATAAELQSLTDLSGSVDAKAAALASAVAANTSAP